MAKFDVGLGHVVIMMTLLSVEKTAFSGSLGRRTEQRKLMHRHRQGTRERVLVAAVEEPGHGAAAGSNGAVPGRVGSLFNCGLAVTCHEMC